MEAMFLAFLIIAATGLLFFAKHLGCYKEAVKSLKSRGYQTEKFEVGFSNFGSVGCMRKIKLIKAQYSSELTQEEQKLLRQSSWFYNMQGPLIIVFIVAILALSFLDMDNNQMLKSV